MSLFHGGPLAGATIACDEADMTFDHIVTELVEIGPLNPGADANDGGLAADTDAATTQATMAIIHRYARIVRGGDFHYVG